MVHLISYDLNGHERPSAYSAVKNVIEQNAISSRRPLYSQWFVETSESVGTWSDRVRAVMDDNDNLFVCRVSAERQGWFDREVWEWLRSRA
jgi:hypothetical protein